jgi:hypothetical protein
LSLSGRFSTSLWWANRVCYRPENLGPHFRHQPLSQNEIMCFYLPSLVVTQGYIPKHPNFVRAYVWTFLEWLL